MNIQFIGQGLDSTSDVTAGNFVINSLKSDQYNSFRAFVAFVSTGGLRNIIEELLHFINRGGSIKLYLGVDLNGTSKEALEQLLDNNIESYIVYSANRIIYHPKIYAFEGNEKKRVIIGSSNLTESGLFQNMEASTCVDIESNNEVGNKFLSDIYDHFNAIIEDEHQSCQLLTRDVLQILIDSKVVLSESVNRAKFNKINSEFGQRESKANKQLLDLFGKIKAKRPPKGFRRTVVKQELVAENNEVTIVDNAIELVSGTMWIETGLMTGGSRNILDLSKNGKLDRENKFGSVSYFGVNPNDENEIKDIDISFGDKIYIGNRIFYAPGNSNWRLRLNGESEDGEKLTAFSIPSLGSNGGFQNRILMFTRLDDTNFRLEVLEQEEMSRLIENSSDWAKGGRGGNGRAYGVIL